MEKLPIPCKQEGEPVQRSLGHLLVHMAGEVVLRVYESVRDHVRSFRLKQAFMALDWLDVSCTSDIRALRGPIQPWERQQISVVIT